jgi:hypothetical protein
MKKTIPAVPPAVNDALALQKAREILADKNRVKAAARFEASRMTAKKPAKARKKR